MRIISGLYKNRPLIHPSNIRPSTQKHKKQVFDTLRNDIEGTKVLDLFSGSGQMGIEALSVGATHVVFVDESHKCIEFIKKNLTNLKIKPQNYQIRQASLSNYINQCSEKYNLIIADPPYHTIQWEEFNNLEKLADKNCIFVLKYSPHNPPPNFSKWQLIKQKDERDTIINFYLISEA
ncbi:MAG: 16S rRNA (guanine(966)-N(2))-methyltransferase RsmD [Patescibacteria group bacterium]